MKSEITPGEWQVDKFGRRFRKVGNIIEYEMELVTSNGTFPSSQASEIGSRMREERQKQIENEMRKASKPLFCPIKALKNSYGSMCDREVCAFYTGESCGLKGGATAPGDTQGKKCPFSSIKCRTDCVIYCNGCNFLAKRGEESNG